MRELAPAGELRERALVAAALRVLEAPEIKGSSAIVGS